MITKIKRKNGFTEINTHEDRPAMKMEKDTVFKCQDEPHPDLNKAFDALVDVVYFILDLPRKWATGQMKVTGVSFSESDEGVKGAVITAFVSLEACNSPLIINTPHLPYGQYSPTGTAPTMPMDAQNKLGRLVEEAKSYMEGKKRAQMSLPGAE